jgi:hypothetical protein
LNQQWKYKKNSKVADILLQNHIWNAGKKWNHDWNHIGVGGGYFKEQSFSDTSSFI